MLIPAADGIQPPRQQRRVASIAARQDEGGHAQLIVRGRDIMHRVAEGEEAADNEAEGAAPSQLVSDVPRRHH